MGGMPGEEITSLLHAWNQGDPAAQEALWPQVYGELKVVARAVLRRRQGGRKQATTSLVHDAALRLLNTEVEWGDRHHFYAVAARVMRFALVDEARRRLSQKRGMDVTPAELADDIIGGEPEKVEEILAVHQALERLAKINPRQEKLLELRYFAGFSVAETAEILGVSVPTVVRDWKAVRSWLYGTLRTTV